MIALTNILTLTWLLAQYQSPPPLPQAVPSTAPVITNCVTVTGTNRLGKAFTVTNCPVVPASNVVISMTVQPSHNTDKNVFVIVYPKMLFADSGHGWQFIGVIWTNQPMVRPMNKAYEFYKVKG